jgi:hypothetical protein
MRAAAFDLTSIMYLFCFPLRKMRVDISPFFFASQEMRVAAFDLEHLLANLLDVSAYRRVTNLD